MHEKLVRKNMADIDSWVEAQEFQITLDADGKIIDYLDSDVRRANTPEERIRQKYLNRPLSAFLIIREGCQSAKGFHH